MAKPSEPARVSHVAVLAFPFGTHAAPLLAITLRLATAAPTAVFSFFNTTQSNSSLFSSEDDADLPANIRIHNVADGVPEGSVLNESPFEASELFLKAAPANYRREIAASEGKVGRKVTCMLKDAFYSSSLLSSDRPANIGVQNVADRVPEGYVFSGIPLEAIELFLQAAPDNFGREIAAAETEVGRKVTCMLTDALFSWFAVDMAVEMKASWVAFWTSGENSLTAHLYTYLIRETIAVNEADGRKEETLGFISGMDKFRVKDIPEVVFENLDSVFSRTLYQMGLALPRATAVFITSFQELDPTLTDNLRSKLRRYLNIIPLRLLPSTSQTETPVHDPQDLLAWMAKRSPSSVAYISFGRVVMPPPEEIVAIAEGLESSKVPFVWSVKEKNMVHLPKGFLERTREQGRVVPWAPQVDLLKHEAMGVFVTHCGWNSVLESISTGVPMICRPFYGDQRLNGRAVEAIWETGMTITNGIFTKDGFEKCLDRVLVQDVGKRMKTNAKKLKERVQDTASVDDFKMLLEEIVKV